MWRLRRYRSEAVVRFRSREEVGFRLRAVSTGQVPETGRRERRDEKALRQQAQRRRWMEDREGREAEEAERSRAMGAGLSHGAGSTGGVSASQYLPVQMAWSECVYLFLFSPRIIY